MAALRSLLLIAVLPVAAGGQTGPAPLSPDSWGVVYDVPATRQVTVREDVPYLRQGNRDLVIDVYTPPGVRRGGLRPAVVFINAIGDAPDGAPVRRWGIYRTWPRLVAAHGLVGISMETDPEQVQESIRGLFRFLSERGATIGVDGRRLGIYAASANVTGASEYLNGDSVAPGIRAAVLYYGAVPPGHLRTDLPVLFVVAQSDAPRMGSALPELWRRVVDSALPWTLAFGRGMPHAFDAFSDTDDARELILQTIGFWRSHLEPLPPPKDPPEEGRAILAALFGNDSRRAAELLGGWVRQHPADAEAHMHLGRVLAELRRYPEADSAYTRSYQLDSTNPGTIYGLGRMRLAQERWDLAEGLLQRAVAMGMENSLTYGQIAWAQMHLGRNAEAVASYQRAFALGIPPGRATRGVAWYNLACAYVRLGRIDEAFAALDQAVEEGLTERSAYEQDSDLAPLRSDPRFQTLIGRLTATTTQ